MSEPDDEIKKSRFDSVLPDILKRAVERGKERAHEAPENLRSFVGDKIPKELSSYVFHQVDETKNGLLKVVAGEVRSFLEATNLSSELQKLLTTVKFEIHTTIRFSPNDERTKTKAPATKSGGGSTKTESATDRSEREERAEHDTGEAPPSSAASKDAASSSESGAPKDEPEASESTDEPDDGGLQIELRSGELPKIRRR